MAQVHILDSFILSFPDFVFFKSSECSLTFIPDISDCNSADMLLPGREGYVYFIFYSKYFLICI